MILILKNAFPDLIIQASYVNPVMMRNELGNFFFFKKKTLTYIICIELADIVI